MGLVVLAAGCFMLSMTSTALGVVGHLAPTTVVTVGYAMFQTANNTAVMADVSTDQRGVTPGMLNLSRNLGLLTGTCVMGAVFALASATADVTTARPEAVASGVRITFAVGALLIVVALMAAAGGRALSRRTAGDRGGGAPLGRDQRIV